MKKIVYLWRNCIFWLLLLNTLEKGAEILSIGLNI
jgi:hypothetical protein